MTNSHDLWTTPQLCRDIKISPFSMKMICLCGLLPSLRHQRVDIAFHAITSGSPTSDFALRC